MIKNSRFIRRFCSNESTMRMLRALPEIKDATTSFQRKDYQTSELLLKRCADLVKSMPTYHQPICVALADLYFQWGKFEKVLEISECSENQKALALSLLSKYEINENWEHNDLFAALYGFQGLDLTVVLNSDLALLVSPRYDFDEDEMEKLGNFEERLIYPEYEAIFFREQAKALRREGNDLEKASEVCSKSIEKAKEIDCPTTSTLEYCEGLLVQAEIQYDRQQIMMTEGLYRNCEDELAKVKPTEENLIWMIKRVQHKLYQNYALYLNHSLWNGQPRLSQANKKKEYLAQIWKEYPFLETQTTEYIPNFIYREIYKTAEETLDLLE